VKKPAIVFLGLVLGLASQGWAAETRETDSFLIRLNGQAPADLADQVEAAGGALVRVHPEIGYAAATSTDPGFAAELKKSNSVASVDRDLQVRWVPGASELQVSQGPDAASHTTVTPSSALFHACQWNLRQVDAPGAWAKDQLGDPGVKVAVLDTGVDPFHVDLAGKIDGDSASMLTAGSSPCGAADEGTIHDLNFHGSFVAGLITSNNVGVAGVAPLARIVGVKVLNCTGSGRFSDVIAGILYAASLPDVEILNLSLGAAIAKNQPGAGPLVAALNRAVDYAGSQGKLVVSAAGGSGVDVDHDGNLEWIPAQSGSGIAVYATAIDQSLASYSNHGVSGTWVGAPGGDLPNPAPPLPGCPLPAAFQSLVLSVCSSFVCGSPTLYLASAGTSFAAPLAAGIAALVDAKHGGDLNGGQLKAILADSADDLGKPGTDNVYSHGRVNASSAVDH
jgi:subtilisin family serine protease